MATYTFEKLASLVRSLDSLEHRGTPRRPSFQARRSTFGDGSVLAQQIPPPSAAPQTPIQEALQLLPAKPTHFQLALALDALRQSRNNDPRIAANEEDEDEVLLEWTLVGRLVLGLYGAHVEELIQCTGAWEDEIGWWKRLEGRGRWTWGGIAGYFFMTLPQRVTHLSFSLLSQPPSQQIFTPTYLLSALFPRTSVPRSTPKVIGPRTLLKMTHREVHGRIKGLERDRNRLVRSLGKLAVQAPEFGEGPIDTQSLAVEMQRVLSLVRDTALAADEQTEIAPLSFEQTSSPLAFLPALETLLSRPTLSPRPPSHLTRPTAFTRLWPPLLLIPLLIPFLSPYVPALKDAVRDARETVLGFWRGWVVEPVMGIIETVRHGGGEGSGNLTVMSKEGMKSDMESLERMVLSLAKDRKSYTGPELEQLTTRIREGDLTDVLKLYEDDIKSPLKSAISGTLVRSLLIQIQKTKVDVDLALSGIDKLLRSQELTFAFVGVAPSFFVIYLLSGYFRAFLSSAGGLSFSSAGSRKERRRKSWEGIRRIERLLTLPPPPDETDSEQPTSDLPYEIQGLLLVSIANLRGVAKKEFRRSEAAQKAEFFFDLLDLENPGVNREAKLRVVERMWRCWSTRLGWKGKSS